MSVRLCIRSLEAVEDIINSNSADGGKYPNFIQLHTREKKKEEEEREK